MRPDTSEEVDDDKRSRKKENRARKEKDKQKGRQDSSNPELAARLREYGENYGLRALAILLCAFLFAAGTVSIGNLFLLTKILHASVFIFGLSGAATAVGMICGGLVLMKVQIPLEKQSRAIALVLLLMAGLIIVLSFAGHWSIVLVMDLLFGILTSMLTALVSSIFIRRSPSEMRGRIGAALNGFINSGMIGSLLLSGPLLDWLGTRKLLFLAGSLAIILVVILSPATFKQPEI